MSDAPRSCLPAGMRLYPLRFGPIYQYRLWGGRHLEELFGFPLPGDGPIGEAWLLSDRDDHASRVLDGPLAGWTLQDLLRAAPTDLLGETTPAFTRFPLLLKFLDAQQMLSVQVHPTDERAEHLEHADSIGHGNGKTEAWVVLAVGDHSRIYAGVEPGTKPDDLRTLATATVPQHVASFTPDVGDAVFVPAGTVHSLGGDVVVFEVQQNSDITFRLFDWDRIDPATGKPRELQIEEALECVDMSVGPLAAALPVVESTDAVRRERLVRCEQFGVWRLTGQLAFPVGAVGQARVLVSLDGEAVVDDDGELHRLRRGDVLVLPAVVGVCVVRPIGEVTVLELSLPERGAE
ncbi:MAG: type I phosphomannose isomerase catalytic subunit [Ilumatobacteraceae bacterium]